MRICCSILLLVFAFAADAAVPAASPQDAARGVIAREFNQPVKHLTLEMIPKAKGCDVYEVEANHGHLTVRGSSPVALCHGFYDYLKHAGLGLVDWSGTSVKIPEQWPDAPLRRAVSPYPHHYYLNVVTYGYTMPYWTWNRWQQELDWMALHGIDMPLALVGTEAIGERVWKELGLKQSEIDSFYTSPAHLPWQRMGNITGLGGPLPVDWNAGQVALQHKILDRMHALGMTPIVPAFAGFVPQAIQRIDPKVTLHELSWAGFPKKNHAWLLPPDSPLFARIGKAYVQAWEKEFGPARYFLADSFNEMQLPKTGGSVTNLLANYGRTIYRSIAAGDSNAVWVVQGWMFGYQRDIWTPGNVRALLSGVPDDKMLILDLANDYNNLFWHNEPNWELYHGFYGKPWIYSVIPNMGGKTAYTGVLDFYAHDPARVLESPRHGREVGYGFAPEGIENNEVIYELLSSVGWRRNPVNLDRWIANYCTNRYGGYPPAMKTAWDLLRQSCYGTFTDHPRFGWQLMRLHGTINHSPKFFEAVKSFLAASPTLGDSAFYRDDAIEMTAICLGLRADQCFQQAKQAHDAGNSARFDQSVNYGLQLMTETDRLLESHPLDRLERWLDFARAHGSNQAEKDYYEEDARRLVTVWGPPINDYSARIWSGLIRDFYRPRMALYMNSLKTGQPFDRDQWEGKWVHSTGVSPCKPYPNPLAAAQRLLRSSNTYFSKSSGPDHSVRSADDKKNLNKN